MSQGLSPGVSDSTDPRSDRALLAAHTAGEPHAFDEIVRRHVDRLWIFALRTLDDREDASDAVQDALVAAFRAAGGYRGESEVSTWLHRIVLNTCLDRIRRRRSRAADPISDRDVPGPRDPVDEHLTRMTVADALVLLPVEQRVPIVLVDMQGFSVLEAAEVLGVPEGTIKSRCARGRARLARALGHLRPRDVRPDTAHVVPSAVMTGKDRGNGDERGGADESRRPTGAADAAAPDQQGRRARRARRGGRR